MIFWRTGHEIADTVVNALSDNCSNYNIVDNHSTSIAYGILRGTTGAFKKSNIWFEIDKGFWDARHYDGLYRVSYKGTQPIWTGQGLSEDHGIQFEPWTERRYDKWVMICPPTLPVCEFFGLDYSEWLFQAVNQANGTRMPYMIRAKGTEAPIEWDKLGMVITFNSSVAVEAIRRGIPSISDPEHSSVGSYTMAINAIDGYDRYALFSWLSAHQIRLSDKEKFWGIIKHYLSLLDGTAGKQ